MTNRLRCVILPAGSREAPCGDVGFTLKLFQFTLTFVVQVWG
jgi:hypothetical protein